MADDGFIFVSHVEEDEEIAAQIAEGLENAKYKAWYYERDGLPGVNYLEEELREINRCQAFILIISEDSIESGNVDAEVYGAFRNNKPIIPLLYNITRNQFGERCKNWDMIIGATRTISIPEAGVPSIIPRMVRGLEALGILPPDETEIPDDSGKEIKGKDGAPMVLIPAGEFQMGDDEFGNAPVHGVYLDAFYIDRYEVTNAQYLRFAKETRRKEPEGYGYVDGKWQDGFKPWQDKNFNGDDQPVVCVSWEDAKAYAEWAGKRLPTEAEWEKAARGKLVGKKYVWGDEWPPLDGAGNFADMAAKKVFKDWTIIDGYNDGYAYTSPVGKFKANGYGLYDMAGNVWEWCADWYNENYYRNSPKENPICLESSGSRVLRGGSWLYYVYDLRVAYRYSLVPAGTRYGVGFRCVSQD